MVAPESAWGAAIPKTAGVQAWTDFIIPGKGFSRIPESLITFGAKILASMSKLSERISRSFFMVNYTRNLHRPLRVLLLILPWKRMHARSSFEKEGPGQLS